uniref:Histidinol-phosphatase n=1 Tax=Candidatus Desulfatibia profunda TaxID=2841695 RepID=A0A8J6NQX3_9BACT|nr:histidinol-phosphatase [Candidatus Desulfatibia profunda]
MESYVRRAVAIGLKEICFLDHLTMQPSESNLSMAPGEIPLYFQALQLLKQRYKDAINVKIGLEIDYNPSCIDFYQEIIKRYPFDVIGGGLHFPGDLNIVSRSSAWKQGNADPDYIFDLYLEHLKKMLDHNYFDVVCHLDIVKKFGWKPSRSLDAKFDQILSKIKTKHLTVEINTGGYSHPVQEAYPSFDIIKKCHEHGICITLGSDAHKPANVGQHYSKILPLLFSAGYHHLTTFTRRERSKISIT